MGMKLDLKQRRDQARVDSHALRHDRSQARSAIYDSGYVVNSTSVERMLKEHSLVPAAVCFVSYLIYICTLINNNLRMRFP
jgi:hypothetical protein